MKYSYVLIDDDVESILRTQSFFDQFPDYQIAGAANNINDAVNLILQTKPNIVFLEIGSEDQNCDLSLDLINKVKQYLKVMPKFVALTLNKSLAYDAIKLEIFDFLSKPTNLNELRKTLIRFQDNLFENPKTLCVKNHGDHRFLPTDEMMYCKADRSYTEVFLKSGEVYTAFRMLKFFDQTLPSSFLRVHNSYIVNINFIARINVGTNFCYIKETKTRLPISKHYKRNIELIINILTENENKALNELIPEEEGEIWNT